MIPVAFNDCAGVLHPARDAAACGRAVIICEAFGYEALCTQRAMLTLARMCAEAGMTTLRFHYPGTGDSAGDEEPGQIDRWIDSIGAAARYLREAVGVADIAICGYRLGGMLAVEAATRFGGISALALLAPVLAGRTYARELILSGAMVAAREDSVPPDWREILGYRLHASDLDRLRGIDLLASRGAGAGPRVLLVSPEPRPDDLDPSVAFMPFQHFDGLTQHAQDLVVPVRVFQDCVAWLRRDAPPSTGGVSVARGPAALEVAPHIVETRMRFGAGNSCFGILTQNEQRRRDCAVLILNSGLNAHTGNGRGSVRLARRLAGAGVTVLRIDMGKIGESAPDDPRETVGFHDLARVGDVKAALDSLTQAGHSRVMLTGICAGAYIALHAAVADPRVCAAVLVNLPYFYIRDEDPAIPLWRRPVSLAWRLLDRTRRWRSKLGRDTRPMLGARYFRRRYLIARATLLLHYGMLTLQHRALGLLNRIWRKAGLTSRADRLLMGAHGAGVRLALVYSVEDWGLIELGIAFPEGGQRLGEQGLACVRIIDGADHTMTTGWMQDIYAQIVEEQLALDDRDPSASGPSLSLTSMA